MNDRPRIKFWNQRLVQHGIASVSNKITALNGQDVCTIYVRPIFSQLFSF